MIALMLGFGGLEKNVFLLILREELLQMIQTFLFLPGGEEGNALILTSQASTFKKAFKVPQEEKDTYGDFCFQRSNLTQRS